MGTPFYIIDNTPPLGNPIANSSLKSEAAYSMAQPSVRQPTSGRTVSDCLPLKSRSTGINTHSFYGPSLAKQVVESVTYKNYNRNHKLGDLMNTRRSTSYDLSMGSILKKTHADNSCQEYAKLLRATVPDLYRPGMY